MELFAFHKYRMDFKHGYKANDEIYLVASFWMLSNKMPPNLVPAAI